MRFRQLTWKNRIKQFWLDRRDLDLMLKYDKGQSNLSLITRWKNSSNKAALW